MSYATVAIMANSQSLMSRVASCAASQNLGGLPPVAWAQGNILAVASQDGWATAWEGAPLYNPDGSMTDTGARGDVISDVMILDAVKVVLGAQAQAQAQAVAQAAQEQMAAEARAAAEARNAAQAAVQDEATA